MTPAKARELLEAAADDGKVLGRDPGTGREIIAKAGRYGPYVTEVIEEDEAAPATNGRGKKAAKPKPRTASLFKDMDLATIDLDTALKLLSLPRVVGADPEGVEITAQNGRYGPYLKRGTDSRSLQTEQQLFDITLEEALAIYAQPKQRGRAAAAAPAQGARRGPGQRQARRRQGRPLRSLRHRRRHQRDPAQGRRPRVDHSGAWLRAARREARQGPHDPQADREEDDQEGAREAGDQEGHHEEDLTFQRTRAQRHTTYAVCR